MSNFVKISVIKHLCYHEDSEKWRGVLGGCGMVAHERHESHVSQ